MSHPSLSVVCCMMKNYSQVITAIKKDPSEDHGEDNEGAKTAKALKPEMKAAVTAIVQEALAKAGIHTSEGKAETSGMTGTSAAVATTSPSGPTPSGPTPSDPSVSTTRPSDPTSSGPTSSGPTSRPSGPTSRPSGPTSSAPTPSGPTTTPSGASAVEVQKEVYYSS